MWIDSETVNDENVGEILKDVHGVIVPGGFGPRGIEGMISCVKYSREKDIPFFGICLGMQIAVIEYARNILGLKDANSGEFSLESKNKVIDFMPGQSDDIDKGGTLRLGSYPCAIEENTKMYACYKTNFTKERHRHRYEYNNDYKEMFIKAGLSVCGKSPDGTLVEAVELSNRDFYLGVQFHPEFKSRPNHPHPLFMGFVGASVNKKYGKE